MLTQADVAIESPCRIDFSAMTRKEATKRFCGECRKHVHDLVAMTEREARSLLASSSTEGLCVRYVADERGRLLFLPDVPVENLTARRRAAMAVSVMAAALSLTACMGAARPEPKPATIVGQNQLTPRRFEIVRGQTRLTIVDQPGVLIDQNAPPPPPGQTPAPHPFLSGACGGGDPIGCSEARSLLDQSRTTDEFLAKLSAVGFSVAPAP